MTQRPGPPLRLYLVRHAETDCSRDERFCGNLDVPLNATGEAEARALAERFARDTWEAIYSSPKLRALQTARPLAERVGVEVRVAEGLREIDYGRWDGILEAEIRQRDPSEFAAWEADPAAIAPPGGETARDILARSLPVIDALRAAHASGNVMVFSHKATLRVLACALLGIDIRYFRERIDQPAAGVTMFEFHDPRAQPLLRFLGDTCHLRSASPSP